MKTLGSKKALYVTSMVVATILMVSVLEPSIEQKTTNLSESKKPINPFKNPAPFDRFNVPVSGALDVAFSGKIEGVSLKIPPGKVKEDEQLRVLLPSVPGNLDPSVMPQNEESIAIHPTDLNKLLLGYHDFSDLPDLISGLPFSGVSGWSVSTNGGSSILKTGFIPSITIGPETIPGSGDPVVATDNAGNFFYGGLHFSLFTFQNAVTIARSTGNLFLPASGGEWSVPVVILANNLPVLAFEDKPWIAVDRSASAFAGSVYMSWTHFDFITGNSEIWLAHCNNTLSTCTILNGDTSLPISALNSPLSLAPFNQFSYVAVGPTGKVYVAWYEFGPPDAFGFPTPGFIRMTSLQPGGQMVINSNVAVASMVPFAQFLSTADFRIFAPGPKIDTNQAGRVFIAFDKCSGTVLQPVLACTNVDVFVTATDNDGTSFIQPGGIRVNSIATGHQFFPTISVDKVRNIVNIAYYSTQYDTTWFHRYDVLLAQGLFGGIVKFIDPIHITTISNEPDADILFGGIFIGDYFQADSRNGLVYIHYNANYLSKGTPPVKQQDNFLAKLNY